MPVTRDLSLQPHLRDYWSEVADIASTIDIDRLEAAARLLLACQARRGIVFVAGNGGSAATASHFACDLVKGTRRDGPPTFRVVPLTDSVPLLTALANDIGYERVFADQLACLAGPGDLLVVISASGNSPNVLAVAEAAGALGMDSIALTGRCGGALAQIVDLAVKIPSDRIEVVEDAHLIVAHSLCVAVRDRLATRLPIQSAPNLSPVPSRRAGR
jgi:D-sedoheptulose 7-phosphate isomerase